MNRRSFIKTALSGMVCGMAGIVGGLSAAVGIRAIQPPVMVTDINDPAAVSYRYVYVAKTIDTAPYHYVTRGRPVNDKTCLLSTVWPNLQS